MKNRFLFLFHQNDQFFFLKKKYRYLRLFHLFFALVSHEQNRIEIK